jgi:glutamate carboxypeptidase
MSLDSQSSAEIFAHFKEREGEMVDALRKLVDMETPSQEIGALDDFVLALKLYVESKTGTALNVMRTGEHSRPHGVAHLGHHTDVLFIGHFDTVYPMGAGAKKPFRIEGDKAYGAGSLDMKAGLVLMTEVARWVAEQQPNSNLTLFFNSDEEIASVDSRKIECELAVDAQLIVVFEFTNDESVVKVGSRGNRAYKVTVRGRGGHAAYPEGLSSPLDAIADVIVKARSLHKPESGQIVVPTMASGGSRTNVVPEKASVVFDVRISDESMVTAIEEGLNSFTFDDPDTYADVELLHEVAPHKVDTDSYPLRLAQQFGPELGLKIEGIEARGTSDLNHIAPINPNVIEALGACGHGAHSIEREHVIISSMPRRAALTAMMTRQALADAAELRLPVESAS